MIARSIPSWSIIPSSKELLQYCYRLVRMLHLKWNEKTANTQQFAKNGIPHQQASIMDIYMKNITLIVISILKVRMNEAESSHLFKWIITVSSIVNIIHRWTRQLGRNVPQYGESPNVIHPAYCNYVFS